MHPSKNAHRTFHPTKKNNCFTDHSDLEEAGGNLQVKLEPILAILQIILFFSFIQSAIR